MTGKQGSAVVQALKGAGFHLRGLARNPAGERAAALAHHGVEIIKADLDDAATLRRERQNAGRTARSCFVWRGDHVRDLSAARGTVWLSIIKEQKI